jgi:hypothetical protein
MAELESANPFRNGDEPIFWSRADEDDLLSDLLAQVDAMQDGKPADGVRSSRGRGRSITTKRNVVLVALAMAAGAAIFAISLSSSGTPGAFAAWRATTTKPPSSQLAAANTSCQHTWPILLLPSAGANSIGSSLSPLVLSDSRGPFEMLVYAGPSGEQVCLWRQGVIGLSGGGGGTLPPATPGSIGVPGVPFVGGRHAFTYAYGNAGNQVTAVTLVLDNGTHVEATLQNGFYGAWWPSRTDVHAAVVTSPQGVLRQDFGSIGPND